MPRRHALTPSLAEQNVRIMPATIRSSDLQKMTKAERAQWIADALLQPAEATDSFLLEIEARLRQFEQRYEFPTSELNRELVAGRLRETADIAKWLFWANVKRDLVAWKTRP